MNENSTESTLRRHEKYDRLIAAAKNLQPIATAVAHPCDETSLKGTIEAGEAGLIKPILVGPKSKIAAVAKEFSLDLGAIEIVDVPHSQAAAAKAVELVRTGKADLLMKGSLHTDELLSEVMKRETGLRTGRRKTWPRSSNGSSAASTACRQAWSSSPTVTRNGVHWS